jgi:YihY family inner membrane protein
LEAGRLARDVADAFREHHLLIAAYAIAFRVLVAIVTGTLCLVGLLGFFDLSEVWRSDVAPDIRGSVSDAAFRVIDDAVTRVLTDKAFYWVTIGAAIAIWQISSVVRTCGQTLNEIYRVDEKRSVRERVLSSIATAIAIAALMLAALAVVRLSPLAFDVGDSLFVTVAGFLIRWTIAAALLSLAVALVVRHGPAVDRPIHRITKGTALTVAGWIVLSIVLGVYLTTFGGSGSVYGFLLSAFIVIEYLYVAALVFLGGLVVDRLLEKDT